MAANPPHNSTGAWLQQKISKIHSGIATVYRQETVTSLPQHCAVPGLPWDSDWGRTWLAHANTMRHNCRCTFRGTGWDSWGCWVLAILTHINPYEPIWTRMKPWSVIPSEYPIVIPLSYHPDSHLEDLEPVWPERPITGIQTWWVFLIALTVLDQWSSANMCICNLSLDFNLYIYAHTFIYIYECICIYYLINKSCWYLMKSQYA